MASFDLFIQSEQRKTWSHDLLLVDIGHGVDGVAAVGSIFTLFMFARVATDVEGSDAGGVVVTLYLSFCLFTPRRAAFFVIDNDCGHSFKNADWI